MKIMFRTKNKILLFSFFSIILLVFVLFSGCTSNSDDETVSGKWLFAMDNDNVFYKYNAQSIPTLFIVDKNGDVVFYNIGYHDKEDIIPYIENSLDGTAESLGDSIDFTVTTFNNETFTLSEKKGEVVLIDIMGVGCPPCVKQMPELQDIKKEYGDEIIILSVDIRYSGENKEKVIETYGEYIKLD